MIFIPILHTCREEICRLSFFIPRCFCRRNKRNRRNITENNLKENIVLNPTRPHEMSEFKRGSKLSNLEVNQRDMPICPPRPVSYTPSSQNDPLYNCNAATGEYLVSKFIILGAGTSNQDPH